MDGERKLFEFLLLENPPLARIFNCLNIVVCVCRSPSKIDFGLHGLSNGRTTEAFVRRNHRPTTMLYAEPLRVS